MLISIVYHISKNKKTLQKSLEGFLSLAKKYENDVELIIVDDASNYEVFKIAKGLIEEKQAKVKYFYLNENQGYSYTYNLALDYALGKYVWFVGSYVGINTDTINSLMDVLKKDHDVISFNLNEDVNQSRSQEHTELSSEMIINYWESIVNKIISKQFLIDNKISFEPNKWYSALFVFDLFTNFKKWRHLDLSYVNLFVQEHLSYNVYDLLQQIKILQDKFIDQNLYEKYKEEFNYWITGICLHTFIKKIYETHSINVNSKRQIQESNLIIMNALNNSKKYLDAYFYDFYSNDFIKKYENKILEYYLKSKQGIK